MKKVSLINKSKPCLRTDSTQLRLCVTDEVMIDQIMIGPQSHEGGNCNQNPPIWKEQFAYVAQCAYRILQMLEHVQHQD